MREVGYAHEGALLDDVDITHGHPRPLVVAAGDHIARADAYPIGGAQTGGEDLKLGPILRNPHHRAVVFGDGVPTPAAALHRTALGKVKIALRIGLKIKHELMKVRRDLHHVVEGLVKIRLPVLIAVSQTDNPVAAGDIDGVLDDAQPERLVQACGKAFPTDGT